MKKLVAIFLLLFAVGAIPAAIYAADSPTEIRFIVGAC